jgi:hypothetical protein
MNAHVLNDLTHIDPKDVVSADGKLIIGSPYNNLSELLDSHLTTYETLYVYLQKTNLSCQHVTEASTYITVHYRNGIHASSRCMDNVLPRTPSVWMECILASHARHAECTRMINVVTSQLITRREDGIRGRDHSINPRNSRDAEQHTYKTRGSSSFVVQESKSDIK